MKLNKMIFATMGGNELTMKTCTWVHSGVNPIAYNGAYFPVSMI